MAHRAEVSVGATAALPAEAMAAFPVSMLVNSPKNEDPHRAKPVENVEPA